MTAMRRIKTKMRKEICELEYLNSDIKQIILPL